MAMRLVNRGADIVIIGAGIAGASLAAEIAAHRSVLLIEAEDQPGYHSTGRSAAFWSETYGGPSIRPLTSASGPWLAAQGFLKSRGALHLADAAATALLDGISRQFSDTVRLEPLAGPDLAGLVPGLRPHWNAGLFEPSCADIDVASLHAAYLRLARLGGAGIVTSARLLRARRRGGMWLLETSAGDFEARLVVDAAGAWADEVACLCDIAPIGIQPYRRTIVQLRVDPPAAPGLPLVIDARGRFYFKPEAGGRLWLSPHDETACDPSDCSADEHDVALSIDRLQQAVDWRVERVEHSWAGLRSFASDRLPAFGFPAGRSDFFWYAGQGGFGIQTAPAAACLAASLLLDTAPGPMVADIDPTPYLVERFAN